MDKKMVVLNMRIPADLKYDLSRLALDDSQQGAKRITVTDLVVEALKDYVKKRQLQDGQQGSAGDASVH